MMLQRRFSLLPNSHCRWKIRSGSTTPPSYPILLPAPFGAVSRARSKWIDLGAAVRERLDQEPGRNVPQVVVAQPGTAPNPDFGDEVFGYGGTSTNPDMQGYAMFDPAFGTAVFPAVDFGGTEFFTLQGEVQVDAEFEGQPAYRVELATGSSLGSIDNRYSNYRLEIFGGGTSALADFRILGHTGRFVFLDPEGTFPAEAQRVRVIVKFFQPLVDGQAGLGPTFDYDGNGSLAPIANVRIGFAFHTDPSDPMSTERWPAGAGYQFDLRDPNFLQYLQTSRPNYVQWDVLFNTRFHPTLPNNNNAAEALSPDMPLPELEFLALPYRF